MICPDCRGSGGVRIVSNAYLTYYQICRSCRSLGTVSRLWGLWLVLSKRLGEYPPLLS